MGRTHASESSSTKDTSGNAIQQTANQAGQVARQAEYGTRRVAQTPAFKGLARLGYAAKGLVYLVIGWLALMTALRVGGQTTDPQGALTTIYFQPFGKFLLFIIVVGFIAYALWQFARAYFDPDAQDTGAKETVRRIGYAIVGITYLGFALASLRLMLQNAAPQGSNASTQDWTARLLSAPFGVFLVILLGLIMLGVAGGLFMEAWKLRFERYFPTGQMNDAERKVTRYTGRFGLWSLSVIFVIIGIFLIEAAAQHNPQKAQGLAGALATLAAQPFGTFLLLVVALGLIAYGIYGFVEARYRRITV